MKIEIDDDFLERTLSMPGALTVIYLFSMIFPSLGLLPTYVIVPMLIAFSIPIVYIYLASVALNRMVRLRRHITIVMFLSYFLYLFSKLPESATELYVRTFIYFFGVLLALMYYLIYYLFYKISVITKGELSIRKRFVLVFIPSFVIDLLFTFLLNFMIGDFLFSLEEFINA